MENKIGMKGKISILLITKWLSDFVARNKIMPPSHKDTKCLIAKIS